MGLVFGNFGWVFHAEVGYSVMTNLVTYDVHTKKIITIGISNDNAIQIYRLGVVTGLNLAKICYKEYRPIPRFLLWAMVQIGIIAADMQEVIGTAVALKLLINQLYVILSFQKKNKIPNEGIEFLVFFGEIYFIDHQ